MSRAHDEHGHHHREPESVLSLRVRALESLLIEKKLVSSEAVDRIVGAYEQDIGPHNGAKVVARAWVDPAYRQRLLADGTAAIEELGFGGVDLQVVENTPGVHNLVVCTLCSCYPHSRQSGTSRSSTAPARYGSRAWCCASSASTCPRAWRSGSGTRAPSSGTWFFRNGPPAPNA